MLLHRDAFTGAENRLATRLMMAILAPNRHSGSVRAIQWCSGWPWRGRRRVAREDRLDEMSRNFQQLYTDLNHMTRMKLAHLHNHHHNNHCQNRWRRWSKHDRLSENRGRWRAGRDREEWTNKPASGQRDEYDDIIKRIEADPYEFLFGRSNHYLQLPKAWSPFCRSFLDIGSARDTKPKASDGERDSERSVVDQDKHHDKVSSDSGVTDSVTSAVHSQELQFDPISGRMVPRSQPVEKQITNENEAMGSSANTTSKSEIPSSEKYDPPVVKMEDAPFETTGKKDVIYLEDTSNSAHKPVNEEPFSMDNVVATQNPKVGRETSSTISEPKLRQFSDFDDEDINQLRASDIRASFASRNENSNISVEPIRSPSTEQVNEAAKHVKGFSGSMQLLNQELMDLCERLESCAAVEPDLYRVLAYDPSTSKVLIAETASSVHATGKPLPPSEVMLSINNPAKFLPFFAKMKEDGYEIVSGGGNILVFRKGSFNSDSGFNSVQSAPSRISNMPIGSQTETATLVNADEEPQPNDQIKQTDSTSPSSTTPRMVRRQETVYTGGPPNWSPYPPPPSPALDDEITSTTTTAAATKAASPQNPSSSVRGAIRRVFLTGFATAGVFYAVGVVCEYFRTGGKDGLGPVGFTEFEAERRRRE
ncbi:hypothetical protein PISL3812_08526 [Talaromyces islandicus]|uniref:Uncharacterized protein n=1 Tax=Talaromyces islandicus TaxID=28573 RepID=A0A0U1M7E2_TALIS|nr:hypothetical protein PISL3812_08526 [Talaromyces islandicus]